MRLLEGKVILVTGVGGGIGNASCHVLASAGARLIVSDLSRESGQATTARVVGSGAEAVFMQADMASESAVEKLVADAVAHFGRLDGAFNNAGLEQHNLPLAELSLEQWEKVIRIDLTGVFLCIKREIGEVAAWLLSDTASFVTGAAIAVDGGFLAN